jgi:hypothetical protein
MEQRPIAFRPRSPGGMRHSSGIRSANPGWVGLCASVLENAVTAPVLVNASNVALGQLLPTRPAPAGILCRKLFESQRESNAFE